MYKFELGVIGGGNMAEAILLGALDQGVITGERVVISEPNEERRDYFAAKGLMVTASNDDVWQQSKYVLLAIKPQIFSNIASAFKPQDDQIVMSIMAGIPSARIKQKIEGNFKLFRIMPNTPLLVGAGMSAISSIDDVSAEEKQFCLQLFSAGGKVIEVEESQMDAVTAISGSGPAYLFYLAENMMSAAASLGLEDHAEILTAQTLLGASILLSESKDHPKSLREKVTSPGGTTEAAINTMKASKMGELIKNAIENAEKRAKELSSC